MSCVLALWRLTADFKATQEFAITTGFFSHWQVWLGAAAILQLCAIFLNRYGNAEPVLRKTGNEAGTKLVGHASMTIAGSSPSQSQRDAKIGAES